MRAQDLYAIYKQELLKQNNCECESWEEMNPDDKQVWTAMADKVIPNTPRNDCVTDTDKVNAERYVVVKTLTPNQLLVWRGVYGFSDKAIDEIYRQDPDTSKEVLL